MSDSCGVEKQIFMKLIVTFLILVVFACPLKLNAQSSAGTFTARQIILEIQKNLNCSWSKETVDTFKSGNQEAVVTGIAVCMFADMETLRKAVANKCNLIIAHEPTFYNHLDNTEFLKNDPVFQEKNEYIKKNGLIIFRFHDHWHRTVPDGIYVGMIDKLGWKTNQIDNSMLFFKFDEQTVEAFAKKLQEKLEGSQLRIVGDPKMRFTNVALSVGASGSQSHLSLLNNKSTELLVVGESQEWETYQYVLDASMLGMKKAAIFTGHIPSEEAGMEYCAKWMKTFIKSVPIIYVKNGSSYWSVQNPPMQ